MRFAIFLPLSMIAIEFAKFNKETLDNSTIEFLGIVAVILMIADLIEFLNNLGKKK